MDGIITFIKTTSGRAETAASAATKISKFAFQKTSDPVDPDPIGGGAVDVLITSTNNAWSSILGSVTNTTNKELIAGARIALFCFTADGKIVGLPFLPAMAEGNTLKAGGRSTFSADLLGQNCPTYLVGASGVTD